MTKIVCPLCKNECSSCTRNQVFSKVKKHFKQHVKSSEYGTCENPDCDIVYFGLDNDEMYFKRDFDEEIK